MADEVSINIKICNRNYKIKVAAENEQIVRDSVSRITEKINTFHQNFPGRDDQDYMAMTLIDFITSSENKMNLSLQEKELMQKIEHINTMLDS